MKQPINEIKRMQQLSGIIKESQLNEEVSPELTNEEKAYLEDKIEKFLNNTVFNSDIVANDNEEFSPTREEKAIQYIIDTLEDRIAYY
jgi:hypothetical protein